MNTTAPTATERSVFLQEYASRLLPMLRRIADEPHRALAGYVVVLGGISIYALVFFLTNKIYLIGSDTFYYMSIADSIVESGSALDLTSTPAQPLKTPQNGVVLFHVVLSRLGLGAEGRLISIVVINYLLHISTAYPLYRIARRIGLEGTLPVAALLAVHLGAFHIYRLQLLPINDGIFNALSIWLTYLIVVAVQDFPMRRPSEWSGRLSSWPLLLVMMIGLSAMLVHFRLNAIVIVGAAVLAAIVATRFRNAIWAGGLLAVSIISIALPYAFADTTRIGGVGDNILSGALGRVPSNVFDLITDFVPSLLFAQVGERASLIYIPFAVALVLALVQGFRKREPGILFIGLSCAGALLYLVFLSVGTHRYLVYVFPLLYLLVLVPERMRAIAYMFVAVVVVSSVVTFVDGFDRVAESRFWLYLNQQSVSLPSDNPLLISERSRHPYFFLSTRSYRGDLTWERISSHGSVFLLGDGKFVSSRLSEVKELAEAANSTFRRQNLTAGYQDEEGHVLLQIDDFSPLARDSQTELTAAP